MKFIFQIVCLSTFLAVGPVFANIPGGGSGAGANVTLVDNGNGTVTMANGIVSITITKSSAEIHSLNYTCNNSGSAVTRQLLSGGYSGGKFYWENAGFGSGNFTYSLVANTGAYAEVDLLSTSSTNGVMDVHFSMLRGSPGFYVTPTWSHRAGDGVMTSAEGRDNIYLGSIFNWMSVNPLHDFETGVTQPLVPAFLSPQENELVTSGPMQGLYFDKYKYGADFGGQNAGQKFWGWSSVNDPAIGFSGQNIGIWHILSSVEAYNGGPMKTELMEGQATYSLNMINGGHYGMGQAMTLATGEIWSHTYGPYFIYVNNVTNVLSDPVQASRALFIDAQAQAAAESPAWPYSWFTNADFSSAANRGVISGQIIINDSGNPNASASNLWVGVVQQPTVTDGIYDFQQWAKPYQFWVKSGANGNFTLKNVIAGNNYTLYAFGPGANGTFMSQNQTGGSPPWLFNLPASPFSVTVTGGATNNLGAITWTPTRAGPTVFEIGYPDRTSGKFRHGDDWFTGDIGPSPTAPSPVWTKFLDYPFDFPNGVTYTVGQNRWNTDWNFIQPEVADKGGNQNASSSSIKFNLANVANGSSASLYIAIAGAFSGPTIVTINGSNLGSGNGNAAGVTATPVTPLTANGFNPALSQSDVSVREGNHGAFSDERITFPAALLVAGQNIINIQMRKGASSESHIMYDYIRLELTGYVPPAPASVTAYAGNNCNLICWPATPGATSYNILRSTTSGSGYVSITNGLAGPVCGSGPQNATWLDGTAANGTTYFYVVQSVNPTGASTNSPPSSGVTPSAAISTSVPATPAIVVASTNNSVTLNWSAIPGANFYTIQRGTVVNLPTGYVPFYTTLNNAMTGTSFNDSSGTLGCTYSYLVTATSAAGTSGNSIAVTAKPVPPPPASAPANVKIVDTITSSNQSPFLTWSPVSGAVGYILYRANATNGPFSFPNNYVMSVTTTNYTDSGLSLNAAYYYTVVAMNAGGVSGNSAVVGTPPPAPANLSAVPANSQITLAWSSVPGATGYVLKRGTISGNENIVVIGNYSGTGYTNTGLANGTTYYYVVAATNGGGLSASSPEASATPGTGVGLGGRNLTWMGDGLANIWNASGSANWQSNGVATIFNNGDSVTFDDTGSNNVPVALSGMISPALVTVNASENYTFNGSGTLTGTNALWKFNSGALTLSETNTYTGGTVVNGGLLTFSSGAAIPASGTLMLNGTSSVTVVTASSLPNVLANGSNNITGNGNSGTAISTLDVEGALTLYVSGGSKVFDLTGAMTGGGTLTLGSSPMSLRFNGTAGDGSAIFDLGTGSASAVVRNGATAVALGGLFGGSGTVLNGNNSSGAAVTYTIGGANADTEFDGVIHDGNVNSTTINKIGTGALTLTGANTYSGGTTVNGGILTINNLGGTGSGSGAVTVADGGTLAGTGIISGPVTVNSGGTMAPGNPLGILTVSNNLTLNSGSTTFVQVQPSPLTNNSLAISGALTEGGTLIVTNTGTTALAGGDSFKLFQAGNYSGAFASFILPPLPAGLGWNAALLNTNGTLSVIVTIPPVIGSISISGGSLILSGTGVANATFYLLTSTNISAPPANWTCVLTNQFDAGGNFYWTNAFTANAFQQFYILQQP